MAGRKGRSGPKPKPTSLKVIGGAFEKNPARENKAEPKPAAGKPTCPRHLNGEAKKEWRAVTGELEKMKVLYKTDRQAIAQYCIAYARWRAALDDVQEHGPSLIKTDNNGNETRYRNPADASLIQYSQLVHRYLTEFGLTPSSRTRLQVEQPAPSGRQAAEAYLA